MADGSGQAQLSSDATLNAPVIGQRRVLIFAGPKCPVGVEHTYRTTRVNGPFAQLLPGLETGHPVTVGQSPTCSFSVSDGREVLFLSPFRAVLGAIHVHGD